MRARSLLVLVVGLASAACIEAKRVVNVTANGSGTVVESTKLGEQAQSMDAAFSQMDSKPAAEKQAAKEANLKARAAKMGEGVRFVSVAKTADGAEQVTYAFDDVNKLILDLSMSSPGSEEKPDATAKQPVRFSLAGKKLTITLPEPKVPADAAAAAKEKTPEQMAQEMTMMRGFLKGLKLKTTVEVPGTITTANVPSSGSSATILAVDFDTVVADEANFKKFIAAAEDPESFDAKKIQGVKGISYPSGPQAVIEFK